MLPTSRLIRRLKNGGKKHSGHSTSGHANPKPSKKSGFRALARLGNRLAEESYRQILVWKYQKQGTIVICDRHFQFDFDNAIPGPDGKPDKRLTERFHRWFLAKVYPSPDLTIFLDAPGEVLFARKGEATVEWLEARRNALLEQGKRVKNFICVDAAMPLDDVYKEVSRHIQNFSQRNYAASLLTRQAA
jgi:hypothetical protein